MTRSRPITFLASAAVIPRVALAVAACGGGGSATASPPKTSTGASATLGVANSSLGSILVNSTGRTLYLFKADLGTTSSCSAACAVAWPHGHPPYLFSGDQKPGDANGQGSTAFGGGWFALTPAGNQLSTQPTTSGGGYGY